MLRFSLGALVAGSLLMFGRGEYVGLVEVDGTITRSEPTVRWIEKLAEDPSVKAMVVKINSPGGGVVASQEIYEALRRAGKPVVAYIGPLGASGGYYVACAADKIVASPGSITGSIGVIMTFPVFQGTMEKLGVGVDVIKSAEHKDIASPLRHRTPQEIELLRGVVMDVYDQFVEVVAQRRSLSPDSVRVLADGRVLTGRQALAAGLVDTLGTLLDALELARQLGGMEELRVKRKPRIPRGILYKLLFGDEEESLASQISPLLRPGLYYLWMP